MQTQSDQTQTTERRLAAAQAGLRAGAPLREKHNRRDGALLILLFLAAIGGVIWIGLHA